MACTSTNSKRSSKVSLNNLPEDLVVRILSLMPTKSAVVTSALAKRWRNYRRQVDHLDFHFEDSDFKYDPMGLGRESDRFSAFVDRVLASSKASPLKAFLLHIKSYEISSTSVSRWIDKALQLKVRELDIMAPSLELPSSLFSCDTITKFKLCFPQKYYDDDYHWNCPSSVKLSNMKCLDIVCETPFENAFRLIDGCRALEILSLEIASHDRGEEDYRFVIPTLKNFTLKTNLLYSNYPFSSSKVVLNLPKVEYLCLDETYMSSHFLAEKYLSSLDEAKVSLTLDTTSPWVEVFEAISGAESIYTTLDINIEDTTNEILTLPMPIFRKLRRLRLKGYVGVGGVLIPKILETCSELEHLSIEHFWWQPRNNGPGSTMLEFLTTTIKYPWWQPEAVPDCMIKNLTTIEFRESGCCDLQVLEFLMGNSQVLKKLTVSFSPFVTIQSKQQFAEKFLELPRASRDCEIRTIFDSAI